jgi:hypothetical protein
MASDTNASDFEALTTRFIKDLHFAGAVARWARGFQVARSLGPFRDPANREVWIDLFRVVRKLRLVRVPGGMPFLTLPIQVGESSVESSSKPCATASPSPTPWASA